jgi:hypothetical protein
MASYPPFDKFYVVSYAANDRDFPVIGIKKDPRVAGYRIPEDLSPHPDSKRYPNHVFTGAQPSSGDQIVTHIYEILPSPWVPFTRYDDDLGPIQGRRRSVKNEGQVASLAADKRVTYEAREGSAIVYTEIEESWSIKTDDDGNSLFPIRDRDFYDASRGPVQERRQLFVPTGEEIGSLTNVNGVITQTSYEPYNEFLSVKVVQTYGVAGPLLQGFSTNNEGQRLTVTTQRKGAAGYNPPKLTATRTVEVSREDAESLIERIVDTPKVFDGKTFSKERPDSIPEKFRVLVPAETEQKTLEGDAAMPATLNTGELAKSEQQLTEFTKRTSLTKRVQSLPKSLTQKSTNNEKQVVTITETLQSGDTTETPTATKTMESEALGDGNYVVRKTEVPKVFDNKTLSVSKPDTIPEKFRVNTPVKRIEEIVEKTNVEDQELSGSQLSKTEQRLTEFTVQKTIVEREDIFNETNNQRLEENWGIQIPYKEYISSSIPNGDNYEVEGLDDRNNLVREYDKKELDSTLSSFNITYPTSIDLELPRELDKISIEWQEEKSEAIQEFDSSGLDGQFKSLTQEDKGYVSSSLTLVPKFEISFKDKWGKNLPAKGHLFFLKKDQLNEDQIRLKVGASASWPNFKLVSFSTTVYGVSETKSIQATISRAIQINDTPAGFGYIPTKGDQTESSKRLIPVSVNIPPCLNKGITISGSPSKTLSASGLNINLSYTTITLTLNNQQIPLVGPDINKTLEHEISADANFTVPKSEGTSSIPTSGTYLISSSTEPYKFGWFLIRAISLDASIFA